MKKGSLVVTILIIATIILAIFSFWAYSKNTKLDSEITQLNSEKESLTGERDKLQSDFSSLKTKCDVLEQDVAKIYKTCIKENACKGRYPGVRWQCNNVGDEVSDPSHTCICDASCNLNATQNN